MSLGLGYSLPIASLIVTVAPTKNLPKGLPCRWLLFPKGICHNRGMNLTQSDPEEDQFDADLLAWLKANCDQETRELSGSAPIAEPGSYGLSFGIMSLRIVFANNLAAVFEFL